MRKSWYDPTAVSAVRLASEVAMKESSLRRRRPRGAPVRLGECLIYPLVDGPGIGLLVFLPPLLWLLSLPVFDVIAILEPLTRGDWAIGLLTLPIFMPLLMTFALTVGYSLLFMGQILVVSALGEADHPRWPEWDSHEISEGLGRWLWAGLFGLALGGFPVVVYWLNCGDIDWFDRVIFAELVILGVGYAQMALAVSLLHDKLAAANPVTVALAIVRVGWDYVQPCIVAGIALFLAVAALLAVIFRMPSMRVAAVALWAFWVFVLYEGMVVHRMLGLTYYTHADDLAWFRRRPKWGLSRRFGQIYPNS
jgi:hypothetical protein